MITDLQNRRTKKMMLWFGMISMAMTFAGLTSAYVVSSTRSDWLTNFSIPIQPGVQNKHHKMLKRYAS